MRTSVVGFAVMAVLFISFGTASADSISPSTFSATIGVGEKVTVHKIVTITERATAPIDIFFLTDTTGSMGSTIAGIRTGFNSIVTSLSGVASDVAFGAGQYKDTFDAFRYSETQDLTTNTATVQAAINTLSAGGGNDLPEANLFALNGVATGTSWRADSDRFVVWAGDAPGHDPSGGVTEASATAALQAVGARVFAASATSGPGLDVASGGASGEGGASTSGQATRIGAATGGAFLGNFDAAAIVDAITDAITTTISTYNSVSLAGVGLPAGVSMSVSPVSYVGAFDRSIDRTFEFDVTFTGLAPGVHSFSINALLDDRTIAATESDRIVVTNGTSVPEPSTILLLGAGLLSMVGFARRRLGVQKP